jgi:phosphoserine phosphatase
MTTFFLIRHGETEWNRELVYRGRKDLPLSENGRRQIQKLAAALAETPITAIHASPLVRAVDTAQAIAAVKGLEVQTCDELIDMDFGEWEGLSVAEARQRDPELYEKWEHDPAAFHAPEGESLAEIQARIRGILTRLAAEYPNQVVALVTHRVVCKLMICEVLGLSSKAFWQIQQEVCCWNAFSIDAEKRVLLHMNDTCHLRAPLGEVKVDF